MVSSFRDSPPYSVAKVARPCRAFATAALRFPINKGAPVRQSSGRHAASSNPVTFYAQSGKEITAKIRSSGFLSRQIGATRHQSNFS
jgi:hypothetical protein